MINRQLHFSIRRIEFLLSRHELQMIAVTKKISCSHCSLSPICPVWPMLLLSKIQIENIKIFHIFSPILLLLKTYHECVNMRASCTIDRSMNAVSTNQV